MNKSEQIDYKLAHQIAACRADTLHTIELLVRNHTCVETIRERIMQVINEGERVEKLRTDNAAREHEWIGA